MANKRRTQAQWAQLIEDWEQSGLSAKQYCEQHQLVLQTFHARRSDIKRGITKHNSNKSKLIKVERDAPSSMMSNQGVMMLRFKACELHLNSPQSAKWVADVIRHLHA